jgi:hypothetical protein
MESSVSMDKMVCGMSCQTVPFFFFCEVSKKKHNFLERRREEQEQLLG